MSMKLGRCFLVVSLPTSTEVYHCLVNIFDILAKGFELRKKGLSEEREYITIIGEANKISIPNISINTWLLCDNDPPTSPYTPLIKSSSNWSRVSHVTWSSLLDNLRQQQTQIEPECDVTDHMIIANEIHSLLDQLPWDNDDYMLIDVLVITSTSLKPSVALYGALLRLKKWLNASIYFITSDNTELKSSVWSEWSCYLPAVFRPLTNITQTLSRPIIWRGPLHIHEYKKKSHASCNQNGVTFPGLELSLDFNSPVSKEMVADTGLCINSTHHPTHLELVQYINMSEIPIMWLSPVRLCLCVNSCYTSSVAAFKELFKSSTSDCNVAVLLRLCGRNPSHGGHNLSHQTTEDWRMHILEIEETVSSPPSFFNSVDFTGPFLLVPLSSSSDQSDLNKMSCHAWLLWKPESLCYIGRILLQLQLTKRGGDEENTTSTNSFCELPLLNGQPKIFHSYTRDDFIRDISSLQRHELSQTPSKWPEIIALSTLEELLRRKIKRTNTGELTLGGVTAPPPRGSQSSLSLSTDLLQCFNDDGLPTAPAELSPVATDINKDDLAYSIRMLEPAVSTSTVSYNRILTFTPKTARKFHGINYCFSEEDKHKDGKLTKIQQRYVSSERSSNCSGYQTPRKNQQWRKRRLSNPKGSENEQRNKKDKQTTEEYEDNMSTSNKSIPAGVSSFNESHLSNIAAVNDDATILTAKNNDTPLQIPTVSTINTITGNKSIMSPSVDSTHTDDVILPEKSTPKSSPRAILTSPVSEIKLREFRIPLRRVRSGECLASNKDGNDIISPITGGKRRVLKYIDMFKCHWKSDNTEEVSSSMLNSEDHILSHHKSITSTHAEHVLFNDTGNQSLIVPINLSNFVRTSQSVPNNSTQLSHDRGGVIEETRSSCNEQSDQCEVEQTVQVTRKCDEQINEEGKKESLLSDKKKKKWNTRATKKCLEETIVSSLKSHGIKRSHACFHKCYAKLFNISKMFVKDLKSSCDMDKQIKLIVNNAITQVVEFELRQASLIL